MDKILAFLKKLPSSLTVWVTVALGVISQLEPVLHAVEGIVGTLSPSKAILITSALAFLARLRSIFTSIKPPAPPAS